MNQKLELRRQCDGLIYDFSAQGKLNGRTAYKRSDGDFWIAYDNAWGWCAKLPETGEIAGTSFDVPVCQQGDEPPEGCWVSRKGANSYVYELYRRTG